MVKGTSYEASRYAIISSFLPLHLEEWGVVFMKVIFSKNSLKELGAFTCL
jgi:hypothetical protein